MVRNQRGQVTAEIAVLFTFIIAAFVFMGVYLQRGAQGGVKGNVDQLGQQFSSGNIWKSQTRSTSHVDQVGVDSGSCSDYSHATDASATARTGACTRINATGWTNPGGAQL